MDSLAFVLGHTRVCSFQHVCYCSHLNSCVWEIFIVRQAAEVDKRSWK